VINHVINLLYVSENIRCSAIAFGVLSVIVMTMRVFVQ